MTGRLRAGWTAIAATPFQRDFWFLDRVTRHRGTYNVAASMRWPISPDIELVTAIATEIAGRQPALRTRLATADDALYALVSDQPGTQLDVSAVRAPPARWETTVAALAREPVDPRAAGTVRLRLMTAEPAGSARCEPQLCAVSHHALIDGRSLAAFLAAVCHTATHPDRGDAPRFVPGAGAAAQLAHFRHRHDDDVAYWTRQLRPADRPPAAPHRGDPPADPLEAESVRVRLDRTQRQAVAEFAAAERSSAFLVLVAAFLEARRRGRTGADLAVGIPVDGRPATVDRAEFGCFTTVLPIRVSTAGPPAAPTLTAMHARLRDTFLDALDHTTITVRDLQSIGGRAGLTAAYRSMATMLTSAADVRPISSGTKVDLALTMVDRDGVTDCLFVYRPGVLDRAEVTGLTRTFVRLLASL